MWKLLFLRRYPFVRLVDIPSQRRVERLTAEVEDLRSRLIAVQQEKAIALGQAEELRQQKDRLRTKVAAQKRQAEEERKVQQVLEAKVEALRAELDEAKATRRR
jgi:chromosome segregation ATPase